MNPIALPVMLPAAAEIFLAIAGMGLLMMGAFNRRDITSTINWMTVASFAIAAAFVLLHGDSGKLVLYGQFATGPFIQFAKILILLGSALAVILSRDYMRREKAARFEFPVLLLFATLGMMMMVSANDLIALYVGIELQSLALYVIASIRRDTLRSTEAGLKYFVLGALSSGMLLYGCSLIYGFAGTTSFAGLASVFSAETYHVAHRKWETKAPIQSFIPYTSKGETFVVGAFACTPVAKCLACRPRW